MRKILPLAILATVALAGCASAGDPAETSTPPAETPAPTVTETETVTPEPTATADPPEVPAEPYRIEDDAILGNYSLEDVSGEEPLVVWADDSYTLVHVIGAGSGSTACQPFPEEAEIDDGQLELDFSWDHAEELQACTADMRIFGSAFPVVGADESITEANVSDWTEDAEDMVVEILPPMGTS